MLSDYASSYLCPDELMMLTAVRIQNVGHDGTRKEQAADVAAQFHQLIFWWNKPVRLSHTSPIS